MSNSSSGPHALQTDGIRMFTALQRRHALIDDVVAVQEKTRTNSTTTDPGEKNIGEVCQHNFFAPQESSSVCVPMHRKCTTWRTVPALDLRTSCSQSNCATTMRSPSRIRPFQKWRTPEKCLESRETCGEDHEHGTARASQNPQ